jgi:uncharacterized protein (TIRG00374 family)
MLTAKNIWRATQYLLAVFFIVLIVLYFIENQENIRLLAKLKLWHSLVLIALIWVVLILNAYKAFLILKSMGLANCSFFPWFKIFAVANLVNLHITQGSMVTRSLILKKHYGFPYTQSISAFTFMTWIENIFSMTLSIFILTFFNFQFPATKPYFLGILIILDFLLIISPWLIKMFTNSFKTARAKFLWAREKINLLLKAIAYNIKNFSLLIPLFSLTILTFILSMLTVYICFLALGNPISLPVLYIYTFVLIATRIVNILPGNFGLSEIICGFFSQALGESFGNGVIVAGVLRIMGYVASILLGIVFTKSLWPPKNFASTNTNGQ